MSEILKRLRVEDEHWDGDIPVVEHEFVKAFVTASEEEQQKAIEKIDTLYRARIDRNLMGFSLQQSIYSERLVALRRLWFEKQTKGFVEDYFR